MLIQGNIPILIIRDTIPERPHGQRTEPPNNDIFQGFQFTTGTTVFHFGAFGILPLFLQLAFNSRVFNNLNNVNNQNNAINQSIHTTAFLSRLLLMIGILLLLVLLLY